MDLSSRRSICENVALIIDGVNAGEASWSTVRALNLQDYESVEFLTGLEAGARYGSAAASRGALVLWTRGRGPHRSVERNDVRDKPPLPSLL
jgi:hypothetical protein